MGNKSSRRNTNVKNDADHSVKEKDVTNDTDHFVKEKEIRKILSWIPSPRIKLGEGSFGSVFAGTDDSNRSVAIKLLGEEQRKNAKIHPQIKQATDKMFITEITVLSLLDHPNIVHLYSYGQASDESEQKALVYERVATDLAKELQNNGINFTAVERLNVAIDVARGLTYMHGQQSIDDLPIATTAVQRSENLPVAAVTLRINGMAANPIWHRDIKSANIGITNENPRRAKLLDCGIAKSRVNVAKTMMTVTGGNQLGTPGYIAPEVTQSGKYGTRSEVYSFGVVLLELLTSRKATEGSGLVSLVQDSVEDQEEWVDCSCGWPLSNEPAMVRFQTLTLSCIQRREKKRPATMRDVMLQLIQIRNDLVSSSSASSSLFSSVVPVTEDAANDIVNLELKELKKRYQELETLLNAKILDEQQETEQVAADISTCCICYDDQPNHLGILCSFNHFTCNDCLQGYVTNQLPQRIDSPDFEELKQQGRPDGSMYCPLRTVVDSGCNAPPFVDSELAKHIESATFQNYITVKMKVGEQRVYERQNTKWTAEFQRIQEEMQLKGIQMDRNLLAEQLQRQFPNAYQCGSCGHGPIDKLACDNLSTHHGDTTSGGGRINNACPSCGWFSKHIRDWPKWNGQLPASTDAGTKTASTNGETKTESTDASRRRLVRVTYGAPTTEEEERIQLAMALSVSSTMATSASLMATEVEQAATAFVNGLNAVSPRTGSSHVGGGGSGGGSRRINTRTNQSTISSTLQVGDLLDVLDETSTWLPSQVIQVIDQNIFVVHFLFFDVKYNQTINRQNLGPEQRLAPYGTYTFVNGTSTLQMNQRIEVFDMHPYSNKWLRAKVIDIWENEVRVHFWNFNDKFDETLPKNSRRIAPYGYHTMNTHADWRIMGRNDDDADT